LQTPDIPPTPGSKALSRVFEPVHREKPDAGFGERVLLFYRRSYAYDLNRGVIQAGLMRINM
jgi:hypothetical protein